MTNVLIAFLSGWLSAIPRCCRTTHAMHGVVSLSAVIYCLIVPGASPSRVIRLPFCRRTHVPFFIHFWVIFAVSQEGVVHSSRFWVIFHFIFGSFLLPTVFGWQ